MVKGLRWKGQGGSIRDGRRKITQSIDFKIFICQLHQCRLALHANPAHTRHTRAQAQKRSSGACARLQHGLARPRLYNGRQQYRLKPAPVAIMQLLVNNAVSEQSPYRHRRHARLPLSQIRWIWW